MRIDNTTPAGIIAPATDQRTNANSARNPQDSVRISSFARGSADSDRIAELSAAVNAGTYHVPALQLAGNIIDETMLASGL
jgi:anti-sigma28 factor (negative regulator of flagellin synthesis)